MNTLPMTTDRVNVLTHRITRLVVQHIGGILLALTLPVMAETVAWDQPATYTDGSPIAAGELVSNTIYVAYGSVTNVIRMPAATNAVVSLPLATLYRLTVTATSTNGNEGERSDPLTIDKRRPSKGRWK
jgi:hypothetical protein